MYYLGIDIGKNTHVASVLDDSGKIIFKAHSFKNTTEGGISLLDAFKKHSLFTHNLSIGMEATGHYWLALYSFLTKNGFSVSVINPIQTDGWRKGTEIRKRKTDIIDSILIADLMRYGSFVEASISDENILSLRNLSRFRSYLADSIADLKRKIICLLDQIFPEYESVFSNVFGSTSKELLLEYSYPADYEDISIDSLSELVSKLSRKQYGSEKANELINAAKTSFGITFCRDSFSFQLRALLNQMMFIEKQVKETESEIKRLLEVINSPITTIPGIGQILGATILGEIGDISRFSHPSKLVAYAGIDASVSQSGQFNSTNNTMSKRGSPYLRRALFQAAFVASNKDPVLRAFYLKKRSEGKHHLTCLGAVSRKLCNIIYAILKSRNPYEVPDIKT